MSTMLQWVTENSVLAVVILAMVLVPITWAVARMVKFKGLGIDIDFGKGNNRHSTHLRIILIFLGLFFRKSVKQIDKLLKNVGNNDSNSHKEGSDKAA